MVTDLCYIRTVLQTALRKAEMEDVERYYFLRACSNALEKVERLIKEEVSRFDDPDC